MLSAAAALVAADARAQATCEEFKAELAARIDATGARGYSLDTAPAGTPTPAGAKVIGTCDAGATLIFYRRWAVARPASGATEPVPAPPTARAASAASAASAPPTVSARPATRVSAPAASAPARPALAAAPASAPRAAARSVDEAVARAAQISYAFDPPAEMTFGETIQVRLHAPGADALPQRLDAQLSGTNFRITPLPDEATPASAARTDWQWQLEPTLEGAQTLQLSLSAEFLADGVPTLRAVRTIDRAVVVTPGSAQRASAFMHEHARWLLALLLVPLAGVAWAWRRHRSAYDAAGLPRGPRL